MKVEKKRCVVSGVRVSGGEVEIDFMVEGGEDNGEEVVIRYGYRVMEEFGIEGLEGFVSFYNQICRYFGVERMSKLVGRGVYLEYIDNGGERYNLTLYDVWVGGRQSGVPFHLPCEVVKR